MGLPYSVPFASVAVTAQQDLFAIVAPSTRLLVLHRVVITQSTDVGDAAAEGLSLLFKRGATNVGSGGSAVTPVPLEPGAPACGATARVNDTTVANTGTIVTVHAENWIIQGPFEYLPTPETRIMVAPSQRLVVGLATTPADSITMSGTLYFEELG